MASAAATSRPRSTWDILADAFGNSAARFDGLTGARIGAGGVDAMVMPAMRAAAHLGSGTARAAHGVMRIGANAFDAAKKAAHVVTHPALAIRGVQSATEAALRRRGYGIALDVARAVVPGLPGAVRDLYKSFSDWPYPAKNKGVLGRLDNAVSTTDKWYKHLRMGLTIPGVLNWVTHGNPYRAAVRSGLETITRPLSRFLGPGAIGVDVFGAIKAARRKDWRKTIFNTAIGALDTFTTYKAWEKPIANWAESQGGWRAMPGNLARWGSRRIASGARVLGRGIEAMSNTARTVFTDSVLPRLTAARNFLRPGLNAARSFLAETAPEWGNAAKGLARDAVEKGIPWIAEKALPWIVRGGLEAGPWGWGAAALAGAALAGYEIYKHPKETKAFLHNTGDFFRNVVAGVRGDPRARKGWHPWADFAASSLRVGGDLLSLNAAGAMRDARAQGHAFNRIIGTERRPGAKGPPMTLPKLGAKAFKFLWNDVIPQVDGGLTHGAVNALASSWSWLREPAQTSRPHAPAPPARLTGHVQAPAVRITQPRRPRAANLPTKTEAEIRVQFNNPPPGARTDARTAAAAFQFETGAQFAF
jgi:hypothetical protein